MTQEPNDVRTEPRRRRSPEGSAYDAANPRRRSRKAWRRLRSWFTGQVVRGVSSIFPPLYMAYCWLVWRTSRVDDQLEPALKACLQRHSRFVALLWHQEVFTVAYSYRNLHGHTLASTGNFGQIVTRMLERCNFTVFRGGTTGARSRQRRVLLDMIRHMQDEPVVPYGITVDGSFGPPFRMKSGGAVIARACQAPIYVVRTWYARRITLPTWDRTAIPLPFNRIKSWAIGPYWIDPDCSADELKRACAHLESEMLELAEVSYREFEPGYTPELREGFPEEWSPLWSGGQLGLKFHPADLDPERPPGWAHQTPVGDAA